MVSVSTRRLRPLLALLLAGCATTERVVPVGSEDLLRKGDRYFVAGTLSEALQAYKMAALAADSERDGAARVEASAQIAHVLALQGELIEGRTWLAQASDQARANHPSAWSRYLLARGVYEQADGLRAEAARTYSELYHYCLRGRVYDRALQAAHMSTLVTSGEEQVEWVYRGIDVAEAAGNKRWLAEQWTNLGWVLEDQQRAAEAVVGFEHGRQLYHEVGGSHRKLVADWTLAHGLRMAGDNARARALLTSTLERAQQRYVTFDRQPNDAEWVAHSQRELAELEAAEGRPEEALTLLLSARRHFLMAGIDVHAPEALAVLNQRIAEMRAWAGREDGAD